MESSIFPLQSYLICIFFVYSLVLRQKKLFLRNFFTHDPSQIKTFSLFGLSPETKDPEATSSQSRLPQPKPSTGDEMPSNKYSQTPKSVVISFKKLSFYKWTVISH